MKDQKSNLKKLSVNFLTIVFAVVFGLSTAYAQNTPLSLSKVLVTLQSKENVTLAKKNEVLIKDIQLNGVTFKLNSEIEKELVSAGATTALVAAIRSKMEALSPLSGADLATPDATYEKIWIEPNVMQDNLAGIRIHAKFTVKNLKDVPSDIVYRFEKDGKFLTGKTPDYTTKSGDLSTRRYLKPAYPAAAFNEFAFIPYKEFGLAPGTYAIKLDADVIKRDGTMVKHLTLQDISVTIPAGTPFTPAASQPKPEGIGSGVLDKIWVEYDKTNEGGKLGMIVHTKVTVKDLKDKEVYLQLLFEKADGTKLVSNSSLYKNKAGQTAAYKLMKPKFDSALFHDIAIFVPYDEFGLPAGSYTLRFNADLITPDYKQIEFLRSYDFTYRKSN